MLSQEVFKYKILGGLILKTFILILSFLVLIKTISYGIYEIKTNSNIIAGITIIIIAAISSILPNVIIYINGII